jgi:histidinol-phosphate/aromatic aminotransferase/cobyric acid decarboxylase-like protein
LRNELNVNDQKEEQAKEKAEKAVEEAEDIRNAVALNPNERKELYANVKKVSFFKKTGDKKKDFVLKKKSI